MRVILSMKEIACDAIACYVMLMITYEKALVVVLWIDLRMACFICP